MRLTFPGNTYLCKYHTDNCDVFQFLQKAQMFSFPNKLSDWVFAGEESRLIILRKVITIILFHIVCGSVSWTCISQSLSEPVSHLIVFCFRIYNMPCSCEVTHDVIAYNAFCITVPLWGESTNDPLPRVDSPHKGQSYRALMFSLLISLTNCWINSRVTSDLRHIGAHITSQ